MKSCETCCRLEPSASTPLPSLAPVLSGAAGWTMGLGRREQRLGAVRWAGAAGNSGWGSPMGWGGGYPGYGGWEVAIPASVVLIPYSGGYGCRECPLYPGGYSYGVAPYQGGANYPGGAAGYPSGMPMAEQQWQVPAAQPGQVPAYKVDKSPPPHGG